MVPHTLPLLPANSRQHTFHSNNCSTSQQHIPAQNLVKHCVSFKFSALSAIHMVFYSVKESWLKYSVADLHGTFFLVLPKHQKAPYLGDIPSPYLLT